MCLYALLRTSWCPAPPSSSVLDPVPHRGWFTESLLFVCFCQELCAPTDNVGLEFNNNCFNWASTDCTSQQSISKLSQNPLVVRSLCNTKKQGISQISLESFPAL
ncbi:hypothetical protein CIPAW_07G069900 [Carya illinoinensis]|uniref:Uncharacterized protein n=1 Tax=Carya illinoinensis TaxID=32201 RepID=A0A8T1PVU6_CARIL|nr:hypothetical protein CIPAW_07G069900 [Carya illinoinensis]